MCSSDLDFHCGGIRFGHIISLLSAPFYWWVVSTFHLNLHEFPLSTFTCAFWRCSYKNNPTMQFTHLSQIYLPMINNFGRPTHALFQSRLPFDSLNKITTMISVTRLQMEILLKKKKKKITNGNRWEDLYKRKSNMKYIKILKYKRLK